MLGVKRFILKKRNPTRSYGGDAAIFAFLAIFAIIMALPMVYSISSALKPLDEMWVFPPRFLVRNPTFKNFTQMFELMSSFRVPFTRYLLNTVFITALGTAGHVAIASMCAYAFAKHSFPGSKLIFNLVVLSLMFNSMVIQIPSFLIMRGLGWVNTYLPYIVPGFAGSLGLFLMKQFMEAMVPDQLLEAAYIDGAGETVMLTKIVMPMVKPAWLTLVIFSIQNFWNAGQHRMIYSENLKPLNYALSQLMGGGITRAGVGAAAAVIMMMVPIIAFLFTQSKIIETMATSGIKE